MVALLVAMSIMAIMMSVALPAWRTMAQREKEAELVFRGEQYARAIRLFQMRYANAAPPDIDVLVRERFLRKKYKDPITNDDFQVITPGANLPGLQTPQGPGAQTPGASSQAGTRGRGAAPSFGGRQTQAGRGQPGIGGAGGAGAGGVMGVVSKSAEKSFRLYNGRDTYNQWVFMPIQQSTRAGEGGRGGPPGPPRGGGPSDGDGRGIGPRGGPGGPRGGTGGFGGGRTGQPGRGGQPPNTGRGGRGF